MSLIGNSKNRRCQLLRKACAALILFAATAPLQAADETLQTVRFGTVALYRSTPNPANVVLFVSGDGGWNLGVIEMAQKLAQMDALVVGIDITHYLKSLAAERDACSYPAADFEALSQFVQKKLGLTHYVPPVLVGYSSGATLVYALIVQAPPGTFRGAISVGFCPDLPVTRPLCKGSGLRSKPGPGGKGTSLLPAPDLQTPWIAFQGTIDQVCDADAVAAYVRQTGSAEIVLLPKVGHGFSVERNWTSQFRESFSRVTREGEATTSQPPADVADLPLVEVPAKSVTGAHKDILAVILSGDGGWASLDRDVGNALAEQGVAVVGLNSLQYFWTQRSPEMAARDLARILGHYLAAWHKDRVLLVGYSSGADVLPFLARRLPPELLRRVDTLALIAPGKTASFEFHLSSWLGHKADAGALPTAPELARLHGPTVLCLVGDTDRDSVCHDLDPTAAGVKILRLKGGHHFGGDYRALARLLLDNL